MPIETSVRTRRPSAGVMALQSAYGTPVDDFRIASGAVRVWTQKLSLSASKSKNNPRWMSELFGENEDARVATKDNSDGQIVAAATPESVVMILQNNWGTMTGTPKVSALTSAVNKYASLAWIESTAPGSTQRIVRLSDLFIYKLHFQFRRAAGKLIISGDYAARKTENVPISSPGGIQFTAAPMTPSDVRVYNVRNATFRRDPAGANVSLDFIELDLILDQQVNSEWTFSDRWEVWKRGNSGIYVRFLARVSNEVWDVIDNAADVVKQKFTISAVSDGSPQSTLTIDLFSVDWEFEKIGHDESSACLVEATGRAFVKSQPPESGFVKFTVT